MPLVPPAETANKACGFQRFDEGERLSETQQERVTVLLDAKTISRQFGDRSPLNLQCLTGREDGIA
jgi:hypothetical protein